MLELSVKRTHKFWLAFFLGSFVFHGLLLSPQSVMADSWAGTEAGKAPATPTTAATDTKTGQNAQSQAIENSTTTAECGLTDFATNTVKCLLVPALSALTQGLAWFASGAAGLFVWVVLPENLSGPTGILNKASVYELWKFIRDFFNLFFILILLLSAFATVFQVENFSIRKIFLNVLIAALVINFSFPITRLLIDLTNVPMYYFLNAILPGVNGGEAFVKLFLGSTGMAGIVISPAGSFSQALMQVVFMFLFTISLLVLGVLFLIRLIALTLLLVFSPFGFAASLMPGFQSLGRDWWSKFWSYALFGPAAALMLLVAIRFQNEIGNDGTFGELKGVVTKFSAGSSESSAIALIVFYVVPLILIWTAIGMANKFSIAGADKVTSMGYGAARKVGGWAKRGGIGGMKFVGKAAVAPVAPTARGVKEGVKDAFKSGKWFGRQLPKPLSGKYWKESAENREAAMKGRIKGGSEGKQSELDKLEAKRQYEAAKEMKDNNDSNSALVEILKNNQKNPTKAAAAAMVLTDRKAIKTTEQLEKAIESLGTNTKEIAEVIEKADRAALQGLTPEKYGAIISRKAFIDPEKGDPELVNSFHARMEKDGLVKNRLDYEMQKNSRSMDEQAAREKAYKDVLNELNTDDLGKQGTLIQSMVQDQHLRQYYADKIKQSKAFYQDAMKKMSHASREVWMDIEGSASMQAKGTAAAKPGDQVSQGGIIIPGGSKTV